MSMAHLPSVIKRWDEVQEGDTVLADLKFMGKQLVTIVAIAPLSMENTNHHIYSYEYNNMIRTFSVPDNELVAVLIKEEG